MFLNLSHTMSRSLALIAASVLLAPPSGAVEEAQANQQPNANPVYQGLRHVQATGPAITVSNFALHRDAATFTFHSGVFCLLTPVNGKITGAVFAGDGGMALTPPNEMEKRSLRLLTHSDDMHEDFAHAVLRFSDATAEEIKKAGSAGSSGCADTEMLSEVNASLRKPLHYNLPARLLEDVLSSQPGGLFMAFIHGHHYSDKLLFAIDPHGVDFMGVNPEEVGLLTYEATKYGVWTAFHLASERADGLALSTQQNRVATITDQKLEATIEKSGHLDGVAHTTLVANYDGVTVIPFDLYPKLRVHAVSDAGGKRLDFIQEDWDQDSGYSVILAQPLAKGQQVTVTTVYGGPDAVSNAGGGNYFPEARDDWYPNSAFGNYARYAMTLRIPKGMVMAATGTLLDQKTEGDWNVSHWKSEVPQAVAGFNFGRMKEQEVPIGKDHFYEVEAYANQEQPDWLHSLQVAADGGALPIDAAMREQPQVALGNMDTTVMMKKALAEGEVAVALYSDYFGIPPYKHVAITQQTSCDFGQSWPTLVYLPLCSFLDDTTRHQLFRDAIGLDPFYFKTVTAHEVAHQWWGHAVGFNSYRDQWMSEGFADFSASLFLQMTRRNSNDFDDYWANLKKVLTERNRFGYRPIDVGPVVMGYRLDNSRTGENIGTDLIYPKGAYILHMIRMMMWNPRTGDALFKEMMHDFVTTYSSRDASTEDFKAMVERHMTPAMDLDGNHKMDWFFNEYVYGTALPNYKLDYSFDQGAEGTVMNLKLTQSNVDANFKMLVPLYFELANGHIMRVGSARLTGDSSLAQKIPMAAFKEKPKRAMLNYYHDVLSTGN